MKTTDEVMEALSRAGNPLRVKAFANHGAPPDRMFGVSVADMKPIARQIRGQQELAYDLYATGNGDAQYLAGMVADGAHRVRVRSILERVGVELDTFDARYEALYDMDRGARFAGVGADIGGAARAKLYVRFDDDGAFEHAGRVAEALGVELDVENVGREDHKPPVAQ